MKILYVDLYYDYGVRKRGLNHIGQDGFIKGFQNLGHDLDVFYYDDYLQNHDQLQTDLIQKADLCKPDLIFFLLFTDQFQIETLDHLKANYCTIAWFGDDNWRFEPYSKYLANHFTWCVTTEKHAIPKYHQIGQTNVILSQWAAIDSYPVPVKKDQFLHDVSFVGAISPYRQWFIHYLEKHNIQVAVFGIGWPNGQVTSSEMNEVFMHSKINLNISNSESYDLRYLLHIPLRARGLFSGSMKEKLRPMVAKGRELRKIFTKGKGVKNSGSLKARNFEIPFFGGFQLSYYFPGVEDFFTIGKEIACYSNIDEAILQINYYLENEEQRREIAEKSHQVAINNHGYQHRLEVILSSLQVDLSES